MNKVILIGLLLFSVQVVAQDSLSKKDNWSIAGYIKDMEWVRFDKDFKNAQATNLVHNRINIKWKPSDKFNARMEVRNRFFWGDDVRLIPNFKEQVKNQYEAVNLSVNWINNRSILLNSNIERLYIEQRGEKWNIRAGRQRINWGINNTWNPNDLFNTYNFLDFDYEERPGSDALKLQYITDSLSNIEIALAATNDKPIAVVKYATNFRNYDLQWIIGSYQEIFTAGFGWAGSIADVGFKGEAQYYADRNDSISQINIAVEGDYVFENGLYLSLGVLFNEEGFNKPSLDFSKFIFQSSPRNLMPSKWNLLAATSKEFTPLFTGSMNVVYSPKVNMLILFPSFRYNLHPNIDLDLIWQSFFMEMDRFSGISHTGYLRVKWSF